MWRIATLTSSVKNKDGQSWGGHIRDYIPSLAFFLLGWRPLYVNIKWHLNMSHAPPNQNLSMSYSLRPSPFLLEWSIRRVSWQGGTGFGYVSDMYPSPFWYVSDSPFDMIYMYIYIIQRETLKTCTEHSAALDAHVRERKLAVPPFRLFRFSDLRKGSVELSEPKKAPPPSFALAMLIVDFVGMVCGFRGLIQGLVSGAAF